MRFKDLTEDDIKFIKEQYHTKPQGNWERTAFALAERYGVNERTMRKWVSEKLKLKEKGASEPEILTIAKQKTHDKNKKIFLISSAQNATDINSNFVKNMESYANFLDAEILIIPYRYKNPTSVFTDEDSDYWDKNIVQYLTLNRHDLNNSISILSDVKIQPTASQPLTGLEALTGYHSCVVGHPRIELKCLPVMDAYKPKIMFTTGSCTLPNFTDSKIGKKSEFHHTLGFAIVEIKDDETFFFRQVTATKEGNFIDLFYSVHDQVITTEDEVSAFIMGDIHVAHVDHEIIDETLNLFEDLYPKKLFIHDIIDSQSISHHNLNDPFYLHELEMKNANSLQKEIDDMLKWLEKIEKYDTYIIKSNHDEHIDKFLRITDWRKMTTLKNAIPYMEFAYATLKGEASNGIVPYVINKKYPNMHCLNYESNVEVNGWLLSMHGHIGSNGSKGSVQQFSKLPTKSVTGHSHQIARIGGAVSVGTSTHLRLDYNKGASSWINAHGIVNRLGKFQHIVFFHTSDGVEYTLLNKNKLN